MSWVKRLRPVRVSLALVLVVALIFTYFHFKKETNPYAPPETPVIATPLEYTTSFWDETLGGDEELTNENWATLNDASKSDLDLADAKLIQNLAKEVTLADLTGADRQTWAFYWPNIEEIPKCTDINILAISPMKLPVSSNAIYSKALIAWEGNCDDSFIADGVNITSFYALNKGENTWEPVREWQIPTDSTITNLPVSGPNEYEMKNLSTCGPSGNASVKVRILVANAWDIMCEDALKQGVELKTTDGFRTREQQKERFDEAVKYYGSINAAKKWVSFADDTTCSSKHCDGTALTVEGEATIQWLNETVGCYIDGQINLNVTDCENTSKVKRMQRYGFTSPTPYVPTYIEFTLPIETTKAEANCSPSDSNVPTMVTEIFRCRLQGANIIGEVQDKVVAEALTVSQCESGWNSLALAFGGKFAETKHPVSGKVYSQAGVFMLSKEQADLLIPEGYEQVLDAKSNINAAASLWLTTKDWSAWGCATGHGELFEAGPVLPQFNGPELPSWAYSY